MKAIELLIKNNIDANHADKFRVLNPIKVGVYYISIQGSYVHYCTPRETLPINEYRTMEISITTKYMDNPRINTLLKNFSRYKELKLHRDSGQLYGYVPIDLINDLCEFLGKQVIKAK
jgi:hypothetical protein